MRVVGTLGAELTGLPEICCSRLLTLSPALVSTGEIDKETAGPQSFAFGAAEKFLAASRRSPNVFCCVSPD